MDFGCDPDLSCDADAFVDKWPMYANKMRDQVNNNIATDWDRNIENLLLLLQVFPSKTNRLPFLDATKKLIVFRVVSVYILSMIKCILELIFLTN